MDEPLKEKTKNLRDRHRISSVQKLNKRIFEPSMDDPHKSVYKFVQKYCPSSIEYMTYIQLLIEYSKKFNNLEIKFSLFEADDVIAKIAKEENG